MLIKETFQYQAALLALGELQPYQIKAMIEPWMHEGIWHDEFLEALDSSPPCMEEVLPAFMKVLAQYDIPLPDKEEALWLLLEFHISRIADGHTDALEGLNTLINEIYWRFECKAYGIQELVNLYWQYEDMADRPALSLWLDQYGQQGIPALKKAIIEEAQSWNRVRLGQ